MLKMEDYLRAEYLIVIILTQFFHITLLLWLWHWILLAAHINSKKKLLWYNAKNGPVFTYLKALVTAR